MKTMLAVNRRGRSKVVRVGTSIFLGLLTVFAVLVLLVGIFARAGKDGVSRLDGHPLLTVLSGSMVPVFHPGDLIVDDSVTASQSQRLEPGDIITFHVPGSQTKLITHRIASIQHSRPASGGPAELMYQTKGVANNAPDAELVAPSQVVGTYHGHVRYAGYLLNAIQKKTVFFLIILLPLLYLIGSEIAKRWREPEVAAPAAPAVSLPADDARPVELVSATAPQVGAESELSAAIRGVGTGEGGGSAQQQPH